MSHGKCICIACWHKPKSQEKNAGMFTAWGYKSALLLDIKVDTHKGNYYEGLPD